MEFVFFQLTVIISRSISVAANGIISFFLWLIFTYIVYITSLSINPLMVAFKSWLFYILLL